MPNTVGICKDDNFKEEKRHFLVDFCILNTVSILWFLRSAFNRAQIPSVSGEGTDLRTAAQTSGAN